VTGRYYYGTSDQSFPLGDTCGQCSARVQHDYADQRASPFTLIRESHLGKKVNEARFGYNRFDEGFFPEDRTYDPRVIGMNTGVRIRRTLVFRLSGSETIRTWLIDRVARRNAIGAASASRYELALHRQPFVEA